MSSSWYTVHVMNLRDGTVLEGLARDGGETVVVRS